MSTLEPASLDEFWLLFGPSFVASIAAGTLCGFLGFFVVTRRIAFVSAALGQISGLGVALGFGLGQLLGRDPHTETPLWLDPVVLALVLTGAAAVGIARLSQSQRTPPESSVALTYLVATALALIVLANPLLALERHEIETLLFGNAVAVAPEHLVELLVVLGAVLLSQLLLFRSFLFVSFDPEMAKALGLPVQWLDLALHFSIGISVAVATRAVGALPVFGFLVLPAGAALQGSRSVGRAVALAVLISVLAASAAFYYSSAAHTWLSSLLGEPPPTGPLMVVFAAAAWPLLALGRRLRTRRTRQSELTTDSAGTRRRSEPHGSQPT